MPEPALHLEKLLELLGAQHESERLDYKRLIDLSSKRATLELVKDIAAMQAEGGYLVIGVNEQGKPTGELTPEYARKFDESRLRAKTRGFLPEPLELRTATHLVEGSVIVLIYVGPHPDGFAILESDGQAGEDFVFRKGDVFVRHGSASERWRQGDVVRIKRRLQDAARGIPELVPAPPSQHRIEKPRLMPLAPTGAGLFVQRVFIAITNVGDAIARVTRATGNAERSGPVTVREPPTIAPNSSEPLEFAVQVGDEAGLPSGSEFQFRLTYEGGGRTRELLANVRYFRHGGFENLGWNIWDV